MKRLAPWVVALLVLGTLWLERRDDAPREERGNVPGRSSASAEATSSGGAALEPAEGRGVRVHDGDTLSVETGGRVVRIRLFGIDAPERTQPFSQTSRSRLAELTLDRSLRVLPVEIDAYGRTVARVEVDGVDVGLRLIEDGLAWHYRRYSDDPEHAAAERRAREAERGLWRDEDPLPPWDFRQRQRAAG